MESHPAGLKIRRYFAWDSKVHKGREEWGGRTEKKAEEKNKSMPQSQWKTLAPQSRPSTSVISLIVELEPKGPTPGNTTSTGVEVYRISLQLNNWTTQGQALKQAGPPHPHLCHPNCNAGVAVPVQKTEATTVVPWFKNTSVNVLLSLRSKIRKNNASVNVFSLQRNFPQDALCLEVCSADFILMAIGVSVYEFSALRNIPENALIS